MQKTTPSPQIKCFELGFQATHIKAKYSRFALISHPDHLVELDRNDTNTLIVSCNWLLWQQALNKGWHCAFLEPVISTPKASAKDDDFFLNSLNWLYRDGRDLTLFQGISLGRRFHREAFLCYYEFSSINNGLQELIERYRPREMAYFDIRSLYGVLDPSDRIAIVEGVCKRFDLDFIDKSSPTEQVDPFLPYMSLFNSSEAKTGYVKWHERVANLKLSAFESLFGFISSIQRTIWNTRPAVLLVNTHLTAVPLLDNFDGRGLTPMVLAKWFPRKAKLLILLKRLLKGVMLVGGPAPKLSEAENISLKKMEKDLVENWNASSEHSVTFFRNYFQKHIIPSGRFQEMAQNIKWVSQLLDRYSPKMLFSDGLDDALSQIFFVASKKRNIRTAVTLHGTVIHDAKIDILGCDERVDPVVDTFFTWGKVNEDWLEDIAAQCKTVRIGNLVALRSRPTTLPLQMENRQRALVLQYAMTPWDLAWPQDAQYSLFVATIRLLNELGFKEVRFKMHPGGGSASFYEKIVSTFGLNCLIYQNEPFDSLVNWADFAVGPVSSGGMLEFLGSNKPYFPILIEPTSMNPKYVEGLPVSRNLKDLREYLTAPTPPDFSALNERFSSLTEIPNPAIRTWEELKSELGISPLLE